MLVQLNVSAVVTLVARAGGLGWRHLQGELRGLAVSLLVGDGQRARLGHGARSRHRARQSVTAWISC